MSLGVKRSLVRIQSPRFMPDAQPEKHSRRGWIILAIAVVAVAIALWAARGSDQLLTETALKAARNLWQQAGPAAYDMELFVVTSSEATTYQIKVRDSKVIAMFMGGAEPASRIWPRWSVEGLFDTIRDELDNAADPQQAFGVANASYVILRARFDDRLGYPKRYSRNIATGSPKSMQWEVRRFTIPVAGMAMNAEANP